MGATLKRISMLFVTMVMAMGLCIGLVGCGAASNDEQLIKSELDKTFSALKNPTEDSLKELAGGDLSNFDELKDYGVEPMEMFQHFFGKFDYKIDGVKIDGDEAIASVTLTNVDFQSVLDETIANLQNDDEFLAQAASAYLGGGESSMTDMYKLIFDKLYEAVDNSDKLSTNSTDIELVKKDGQWDLTDKGEQDLQSALFGGLDFSSL